VSRSDEAAAIPSVRAAVAPRAGTLAPASREGWIPALIAAAWGIALVAGMGILWRYKSTPGPETRARLVWPEASQLPAERGRPTLVLFAHPECPCTRATILALREILPRFATRVSVCVAALHPEAPPAGWNDEGLQDALDGLAEASLFVDASGREARLFGALTSGHVLLYGTDGGLRFSGGITGARGHAGDNPGLSRLERALEAELRGAAAPEITGAPVFGCSLFDAAPSGGTP
jgi:hypothetical protein